MSGVYKAIVRTFDPLTKQVTAIIPQLFGAKPVTCDPFLAREADRSLVGTVSTGDRVTVIWDGDQPNAVPEWLPMELPTPDPITSWTNLTLTSNWVANGGRPIQYRKVWDSVEMRGQVTWQSPFGINPMATFPVGFRPQRSGAAVNFPLMFMDNSGQPLYSHSPVRMRIETDGTVNIEGMDATLGHFTVDNVRFSTLP